MASQKVAVENNYTEAFRQILETTGSEASWLRMLRENAIDRFQEIGFPTVKQEEWKYTNVAPFVKDEFEIQTPQHTGGGDSEISENAFYPEAADSILAFQNGVFKSEKSSFQELSECFVATSLQEVFANEKYGEIFRQNFARLVSSEKNGFTALNTAFAAHGAFLFIPKNTKIEAPIHLLFHSSVGDATFATFPRVFVFLEAGSEATLIEHYTRAGETKYFTNSIVEIVLEDNARLKHYRVQRESHAALHIGSTGVSLQRDSFYDTTNLNFGAALFRHDIGVRFNAEGAECFVDGLYMVGDVQHTDTHSTIEHLVPRCKSNQTYKGVLSGKSRAVFNGKVFVAEGASGTDGYQSNKNLLLSNDARVDTKPQLEIFNDDVKCSHGATVGQIEEEELFYLLSRGLSEPLARNLLTYGFAEEVINKIEIESIKKQLDEAVLNRLETKLD
ncbi:MAG: Fe-S cluster assembly protein SufD [Acidobacteriota bacterium]|nr:Fe-S cluster assembly protein SufD [Acidobacteriota bacterium]